MARLIPIGHFSQLCRLSIKTLRHYDAVGLLKPAETDPWTHYRYYTLEQAALAEQIRLLRATDMPIEEIRLFLVAHSENEAHQIAMKDLTVKWDFPWLCLLKKRAASKTA